MVAAGHANVAAVARGAVRRRSRHIRMFGGVSVRQPVAPLADEPEQLGVEVALLGLRVHLEKDLEPETPRDQGD